MSQTREQTEAPVHDPPVMKWRYSTGRDSSIEVAVWANIAQGEKGPFTSYSATFRKSYRDKGEWKNTDSVRSHELLTLSHALIRAFDWIAEQKEEQRA